MPFCDPYSITRDVAALVRPPEPITPSQAAERYLHIAKPGGGHGLYDPSLTPYSTQILNALDSREHDTVVFIAPAQSGKSTIVEGKLAHTILCNPGDTTIYNPSEKIARDYSMLRIDRMLRHSPELRSQLSPRRDADNRFDKHFRNGMILFMGFPAISQMSGKSLRNVILSDYDRFPLNIDGEGSAVGLTRKRITAFGSSGIQYVESSPGWDITDGAWRPKTPHEGPPCPGIIDEYNHGTRNRWYWTCPHCAEEFEADFDRLKWDTTPSGKVVKKSVVVVCPHCAACIPQSEKHALNAGGRWISEAERLGEPEQPNSVDSYWLKGPAAAFVEWATLAERFVNATAAYERSGDEAPLREVTNTDLGLPYLPIAAKKSRSAQDLIDHAEEWEPGELPADDIQVAIATADVQGNRFVAAVHGYALRDDGIHTYCLHRQEIHWSDRKDAEGKLLPLDPATHRDDWNTLLALLDLKFTGSDIVLRPCMLLVDSGGRDGVTNNAYAWWRRLGNLRGRVRLVKGEGTAPQTKDLRARVIETYVGGVTLGRKKKPDVLLLRLNTNELKDLVSAEMDRLHLPTWLEDRVYEEIVSETRDEKGCWVKISRSSRNEQADLLYYARAALVYLGSERWGNPWALPNSVSAYIGAVVRQKTEAGLRISIVDEDKAMSQPTAVQKAVEVKPQRFRKSSALTL